MKRVTGIGGIFFKAKDAPALQAWYKRHLAIDVQEWGGTAFTWADSDGKPTGGTTIWSVGPEEGDQFAPSKPPRSWSTTAWKTFTLWSRRSKRKAATSSTRIDESEFGKFAWVINPEETRSNCGNHLPVDQTRPRSLRRHQSQRGPTGHGSSLTGTPRCYSPSAWLASGSVAGRGSMPECDDATSAGPVTMTRRRSLHDGLCVARVTVGRRWRSRPPKQDVGHLKVGTNRRCGPLERELGI